MAAAIENGDYIPFEQGLKETEYINALLQDIKIAIQTKRGSFYPDKAYGCDNEGATPAGLYALCRARQATAVTDGVFIKSVSDEKGKYIFNICINDEEGQVSVQA